MEFIDQIKRSVAVKSSPKRIISLVPSQTELLYDLGLEEEVIGITKFCVHPESWYKEKKRVGGTKAFHREIIDEVKPDFIIANKEENRQEEIEALMKSYPVWVSDVNNLEDAMEMILALGEITGKVEKAVEIAKKVNYGFEQVPVLAQHRKVAYMIWREPYMVVGKDTFINDMLKRLGFVNVFEDKGRYEKITDNELFAAFPQLILLSSEPYPFKEKHIEELYTILPTADVRLVDGEMFSWYGSRLLKAPAYFRELHQSLEVVKS